MAVVLEREGNDESEFGALFIRRNLFRLIDAIWSFARVGVAGPVDDAWLPLLDAIVVLQTTCYESWETIQNLDIKIVVEHMYNVTYFLEYVTFIQYLNFCKSWQKIK